MDPTCPILIISGTNRPNANTHKMARVLQRHYRERGVRDDFLSLCDLPPELFHPSSYASKPAAFAPLQERVLSAAGLHIVTPEYNGSFPGVLKYFIDMLKFPDSFDRKPVAFLGLANGSWGALRAVEQLQMVFAYRNAHVYPERVFVPGVKEKLDGEGNLKDAALDERVSRQAAGFAEFAYLFSPAIAAAR